MLEFPIKQEAKDYAARMVADMQEDGPLHTYGSEKGRAYYGYIGQWSACDLLGAEMVDRRHYDFLYRGFECEVKTISCSTGPMDDWLATVNSSSLEGQTRQNADYYIFVRIHKDETRGWLLGHYEADAFFRDGRFVPKGEVAFTTRRGEDFVHHKAHSTVLPVARLQTFRSLEPEPVLHPKTEWQQAWERVSAEIAGRMAEGPLGRT